MECATGNEVEMYDHESIMRLNTSFYIIFTMNIIIVLKLAFQTIMQAGDQKLMINLEWPKLSIILLSNFSLYISMFRNS